MQHTTKMVMVPEEAYSSLVGQQQQLMPPIAMQLSNLDSELKSILTNPSLNVDEKYNQYYQIFKRYGHLHGRQFNPPEQPLAPLQAKQEQLERKPEMVNKATSTFTVPVSEQTLLQSLPKIARRRGKLLLEHLKRKRQIQWNDNGELMANGSPVEGSNVTDLLHFFTRDRPSVVPPKGAAELADLLQETNVPVEAVVPNSFNQTGMLAFNLGTLFSPKNTPVKKSVKLTSPRSNLTKRKKMNSTATSASSALAKRKTTRPMRYANINWEEL
jgi:hypothetical protein